MGSLHAEGGYCGRHGHKIIPEWPRGTTDFIRSCISVDMTYCSQRELGLTKEKIIKESYKI